MSIYLMEEDHMRVLNSLYLVSPLQQIFNTMDDMVFLVTTKLISIDMCQVEPLSCIKYYFKYDRKKVT